jgi:hypothetical protein
MNSFQIPLLLLLSLFWRWHKYASIQLILQDWRTLT